MIKSVWSGHLSVGIMTAPIKLYCAAREEKIEFHQYHDGCGGSIKLGAMRCAKCEKEVKGKIIKGTEYGGQLVYLTKEDFEDAKPKSSSTIKIERFINAYEIDPVLYNTSYYVTPDKGGDEVLDILANAMEELDKYAICSFFFSGREHLSIIRSIDLVMYLHTLYLAPEIREGWAVRRQLEKNNKSLIQMKSLIKDHSREFNLSEYCDGYLANLNLKIREKLTANR